MKKWSSIVPILLCCFAISAHAQGLQEILSGNGSDSSKDKESTANRSPRSTNRIHSNLESHSIGVGIGQTFLKSDFGRAGDDKITWDLFYNYRASHSFDFIANYHFMKHRFGKTFTQTNGLALGIKARVFQFDNFSPYVLGGFGFYQPKIRRDIGGEDFRTSDTKTTFGWHIGSGAELQLNRHFSAGVLLHIHNPFSIQQEQGPDVRGWYYKLLLTGMYTF